MKHRTISNLEELKQEKLRLKAQLDLEEDKLQEHYKDLEKRIAPLLSVLNFFGLGKDRTEEEDDKEKDGVDWTSILKTSAGIGGALVAGRMLYKSLGSTLLKTVLTVGGTMLLKKLSDGSVQEWIGKLMGNTETEKQED